MTTHITPDQQTTQSEWREGWRALVAGSIGYGTGLALLSITGSLFVKPMVADLGWSTKAVSIVPIVSITTLFCLPIVGILLARWGSRAIGLAGLVLFPVALLLLAIVPPRPVYFYAATVFLGVTGSLVTAPTFARCISTWFDRHAGAAFGLTLNGVSFVSLLSLPVASAATANYGWRGGLMALSLITLLIGLPMAVIWLRERPSPLVRQEIAHNSGFTLGSAIRDIRFWILCGGLFLGGIPLGGFLAHLQALLAENDMERVIATSLGLVLAISISLGRVGGGFLLDRFFDGAVACALLVTSAGGAVLLAELGASSPLWLAVGAVLLVGIGQGAESDFVAYFTLKLFGTQSYPKIVSILSMVALSGFSVGGLTFAALRDQFGDYRLASYFGAGCFIFSGLLFLLTRVIRRQERKVSEAYP